MSADNQVPPPRIFEGLYGDQDGRASAEQEAKALAAGDLERQARESEHRRNEKFRDHFSHSLLLLVWIIFFLVASGIIIRGFHLFAPLGWHFLVEDQIKSIDQYIFGGLIAIFIQSYAGKAIKAIR